MKQQDFDLLARKFEERLLVEESWNIGAHKVTSADEGYTRPRSLEENVSAANKLRMQAKIGNQFLSQIAEIDGLNYHPINYGIQKFIDYKY